MSQQMRQPTRSAGIMTTGTILDKIVTRKLEEVAALKDCVALDSSFKPLDFVGALLKPPSIALIAEIKHASPSKGVLIENFDQLALGKTYAENGATAISVLT